MCFSIKLRVNQSQAVREATEDDFVAEKVHIKVDYDKVNVPSAMWEYESKICQSSIFNARIVSRLCRCWS